MKNIDIKSLTIGVLLTIIVFISISASSQNKNLGDIEVKSISIVDDDNNEIAYLGSIDNQSVIILDHPESNDQLVLSNNKDDSGIAIARENTIGKMNAPLLLGVYGKNTMPLIQIMVEEETRLYIGPGKNESITTLELYSDIDDAALVISNRGLAQANQSGDNVFYAGSSENGDGMLTILNKDKQVIWTK